MSLVSDSSVREPFWTKCKILAYGLSGRLLIHLWSHLPHALVVSSPPRHHHPGPLAFVLSRGDLYHRLCISAWHHLDCFPLSSLPQLTIVFQFGMAPLMSRFSESKKNSRQIYLSPPPPPPPSPLSPSFSDGLSQGQEFRVVCLPQNRAEDIWWTAVGCDCGLRCAPTGSGGGGGDLLTLVAAYELLWSRNVSEVHSSISLCYTEPSRFRWNLLKDIQGNISDRDGHFNCAAPPQGH